MPISRDDFRCYDPIVLKKVAQVYLESAAVFRLAFESGAELGHAGPTEDELRLLALVKQFGRDPVLAALHDLRLLRLEAFEKVFGRRQKTRSFRGRDAVIRATLSRVAAISNDDLILLGRVLINPGPADRGADVYCTP